MSVDRLRPQQCREEAERDYLLEAYSILGGHTRLMPEKRHLEALQEQHEANLLKIAKELTELRKNVLDT